MSKLEKLIKKLCPNGVEYKELDTLVDYIQPTKYIVKSTKYNDEYDIPVLTPGQTFILGYTNEKEGIYNADKENPIILFDDFTTAFRWINFKFKVKSSAVKILIPKNNNINFRYIFYTMQTIKFDNTQHNRQWISKYSILKIPVPPIEVQNEIVRILDNFTELEAELESELELELEVRKEQYNYYFYRLMNSKQYKKIKLSEIGKVKMCKRILKNQTIPEGDIPFYKIGTFGKKADAYISEETFKELKTKYSYPQKGDILISCSGTIGRTVVFDGRPAYFQDSNIVWLEHDETIITNSFLKYCYSMSPWRIATGGTIARLYNDNILNAEVLVPTLDEQERIVSILDRFDKLCNDISEGLPAEIEARRKQYEYYRDKLLNFKELKVENKE